MPSGTRQAPPLVVWAGVAIGFLMFLLAASRMTLVNRARRARSLDQACASRLRHFGGSPAPRVIALGSSLLTRATVADRRMGELSRREGGPDLHWLLLSKNSSSMDTFQPVLDRILETRPQVLLVEADLLYFMLDGTRPWPTLAELAQECRTRIRRSLTLEATLRDFDPELLIREELPPDRKLPQDAGALRAFALGLGHRQPRGPMAKDDPILLSLRRAHDRGTRIVLLELPRFQGAEASIPVWHLELAGALKAQLARECGARILVYPGRFALDHYLDFSHLNQAGAEQLSPWLVKELAGLLAGAGGPCS